MIGPNAEQALSSIAVLVSVAAFSSFAVVLGARAWVGILIGTGITLVLAVGLLLAARADDPKPLKPKDSK